MSDALPLDPAELDRYFAGEATLAERNRVAQWIAGRADRAALLDALRAAPSVGSPAGLTLDIDAAWQSARPRMGGPGGYPQQPTGESPSSPGAGDRGGIRQRQPWPQGAGGSAPWRPVSLVGVAAIVLTIVGGAVVTSLWRHVSAGSLGAGEYTTVRGQRAMGRLPDGTQFTLAPASRLSLAADYGRARRDVYLDGEAYFVVRHDATRPFAVHAVNAVASDVGTQFAVRAYRDDRAVRVVVVEGQVSLVTTAGREVRATPAGTWSLGQGDLAVVDAGGRALLEHEVDADALTAWIHGALVFRDTPLRDVARDLNHWYGLDIRIADPALANRPLTATYDGDSLAQLLTLMSSAVGAHAERNGNVVTLTLDVHGSR